MIERIKGGLVGAIIGDAMGVPVEFFTRNVLINKPVTDLVSGSSHMQPRGTWSDDSSMILCTVESLLKGLDYDDIANNFYKWIKSGYWTPYGEAFGIGRGTLFSIGAISKGTRAIEAGQKSEKYNGNGSLMRILPIAFYINKMKIKSWQEIVINLSSITHAHLISCNSCIIYINYALDLLDGLDKFDAYEKLKKDKYITNFNYKENFSNILENNIYELNEDKIKSSGYVIDTLEAAFWSFLTTNNYKECILKAVNLGGDTDTIACIAGGLAGIYYGFDDISNKWVNEIARSKDILNLIECFSNKYAL